MKKKYDFVKNDHDSLGSLHNTDFEGKKQKKTTYFCMKIQATLKEKNNLHIIFYRELIQLIVTFFCPKYF